MGRRSDTWETLGVGIVRSNGSLRVMESPRALGSLAHLCMMGSVHGTMYYLFTDRQLGF